jgi:hypothetical protein
MVGMAMTPLTEDMVMIAPPRPWGKAVQGARQQYKMHEHKLCRVVLLCLLHFEYATCSQHMLPQRCMLHAATSAPVQAPTRSQSHGLPYLCHHLLCSCLTTQEHTLQHTTKDG